jgi:hypothetical protein
LLLSAAALMTTLYAVALVGDMSSPARPADTAWAPKLGGAPASPPEGAASAAQASRVSAADLWMAYARDPAGADRRFRDRPVLVNGTVRSIDRDFDGRMMVRFSTGESLETVNAKLASQSDGRLLTTSKGKVVSLLCVGQGALIGAPLLGGCSIYSG